MPQDYAATFLHDPRAFVASHPISLHETADGSAGLPQSNTQYLFTLSSGNPPGMMGAWGGGLPALRAHADMHQLLIPPPNVGLLPTIRAKWCSAGAGGLPALNTLPYCDVRTTPHGTLPRVVFTDGMNGCGLFIATAVPAAVPPLAPNCFRVLHDRGHRSLASWHAAGYTIRFAAYPDAASAGPIPGAFAVGLRQTSYDPNNYDFDTTSVLNVRKYRVVTNFLWYDGNHWQFCSRHYHEVPSTRTLEDFDCPHFFGGQSSTQVIRAL